MGLATLELVDQRVHEPRRLWRPVPTQCHLAVICELERQSSRALLDADKPSDVGGVRLAVGDVEHHPVPRRSTDRSSDLMRSRHARWSGMSTASIEQAMGFVGLYSAVSRSVTSST